MLNTRMQTHDATVLSTKADTCEELSGTITSLQDLNETSGFVAI